MAAYIDYATSAVAGSYCTRDRRAGDHRAAVADSRSEMPLQLFLDC